MTTDQYQDFSARANGTLEALVLAFGALAALHPEKEKVAVLINQMIQTYSAESDQDTEHERKLKAGMKQAALTLKTSIDVAKLAEERLTANQH